MNTADWHMLNTPKPREPQLKDPRCPHCRRPVVGFGNGVLGHEGTYHMECVQSPHVVPMPLPTIPMMIPSWPPGPLGPVITCNNVENCCGGG